MKVLGYLLFAVCIIIGSYINIKCGFGIMVLYYIGALCFALYKLFTEEK